MSQQQFIPTPKFEEYKERFKDFYKMQRRSDGVILVEAHTKGGPIQLSVENGEVGWADAQQPVGADPENEDGPGIRHGQRNSSSRKTYRACLQVG